MSYCVNCGVELDKSAKKCVLCDTPVINPNIRIENEETPPFSEELMIPEGVKKRFIAFIATIVMLLPCIVMFFLNVFFVKEGFWAVKADSVILLLWFLFVMPLLMKKINPYVLWAVDTLAVLISGLIFFSFADFSFAFIRSLFSVIAAASAAILILIIWLRRKKHHWTSVAAVLFGECTVTSVICGFAISHYTDIYDFFVIGMITALCCAVVSGFFVYFSRSKYVREWLNKTFYV